LLGTKLSLDYPENSPQYVLIMLYVHVGDNAKWRTSFILE
jgi:hypothetical protein